MSATLTPQEQRLVESLAKVWNNYLELPLEHQDDHNEFRTHIHALQNQILARPARRVFNKEPDGIIVDVKL